MTNVKDDPNSKHSTPLKTPRAHDHASHDHASHGHGHGGHHHVSAAELSSDIHRRRVLIVLVLTAIYMVVEFIGGKISNSLALWSDATHLLTDVGALSLTFLSFKMGQLPASSRHTFGLRRAEILGAFVNGLLLTLIAVFLIYQALLRIHSPENIDTTSMFIVAAVGLLVNLVSGGILIRGSHDNLAVRGALLHIMGDALGSLGAMIAAGLIWKWGWTLADPIVSLGVAVLILISSISFIRDTAHIILQGSPRDLQSEAVEKAILEISSTVAVHSLHIWSLTPGQVILSAHVVTKTSSARDSLRKIQDLLKNRFGVAHTTIQIEEEDDDLTCVSIDSGTHLPNA